MNGLNVDDIRELHEYALTRYGGIPGERDPGCVSFMAEKPFYRLFGQKRDAYPGLFMKAAVYMHGLIIGHCFSDGNKRTGYLAAYTFLKLNGYEIFVSDEELYNKAKAVANKNANVKDLSHWLKEHSKPSNT